MANPKQKKLHTRSLNAARGDKPTLKTDEGDWSVNATCLMENKPKLPPPVRLPVRPQWLAFGVSVVLFVAWLLFLVFVAYEVLS